MNNIPQSNPEKTFLESTKDYYIEQITSSCFSQFSYYIESNNSAIIIDPMRDIDNYLDILKKRNSQLKYIFETHFHADFVSGHLELSKATGAIIIFGPNAEPNYDCLISIDNQEFQIGEITIKLIHTPGHTLESSSLILIDQKNIQKTIFTGDTIFLGEVGRPDLAVKGDLTEKDLAALLYDSVQKINKLPDDIIIFPGHGSGSACGKKISAGNGDSLSNQRLKNWAFANDLNKEKFLEISTENIPLPPPYFFHIALLNKNGYEFLEEVLKKSLVSIKFEEFEKLSNEENTFIIDTRDFSESLKGFIKKSIIIPLKIPYSIWTATLFKPENRILIVSESGKEKESIIRLARVGYHNVIGFLEGGMENYKNNKKENIDSIVIKTADEVLEISKGDNYQFIDVREKNEWINNGILKSAKCFALSQVDEFIDEIRKIEKPKGIYCKTGGRASVFTSILKRNGLNDVVLFGGFDNLKAKGCEIENYNY